MDINKDYYSILGILPSAELVVIKAAYIAMLKVYHPDKFEGTKEEGHSRTIEINEAYQTLSNKEIKAKYDQFRAERSDDNFSFKKGNETFDNKEEAASQTLDKDWALATKYQPDLISLESKLFKISSRLAFTFRLKVLEFKVFKHAEELAEELENLYLESYFGTNDKVIEFAKRLIKDHYREAANELNQIAKVFGDDIDADKVIHRIKLEFKLYEESSIEKARARSEQEKKVQEWIKSENKLADKAQKNSQEKTMSAAKHRARGEVERKAIEKAEGKEQEIIDSNARKIRNTVLFWCFVAISISIISIGLQ